MYIAANRQRGLKKPNIMAHNRNLLSYTL
jgi:hypothetical protein